ncbi:VWA domain-containing protein [Streptomyces sp. NPDC005349]|uniref:VWA domain-containing protein n=1 Tax=Streptomyces sp. NPDC005349 TaxID=3157037 RepID=UPI0033B84A11
MLTQRGRGRDWVWLHRVVLDELGAGASWTGRDARSIPSAPGPRRGPPFPAAPGEASHLRAADVPRHRIVDNAGYFPAGRDPRTVGDDLLCDRLLQEFPSWLASARTAQVLQ